MNLFVQNRINNGTRGYLAAIIKKKYNQVTVGSSVNAIKIYCTFSIPISGGLRPA